MTVTVYGKPDCAQCEYTKKHLTRNNVPFLEFDVTDNKGARKVVEDSGSTLLPYVVVEHAGQIDSWHGFKLEKIRGLNKNS